MSEWEKPSGDGCLGCAVAVGIVSGLLLYVVLPHQEVEVPLWLKLLDAAALLGLFLLVVFADGNPKREG
jgi:hypothetical protein